ncbi:MAG: PLP-dependent aspartate aminotransferase family protein [Hyphomonadaceae bacterium]
MLKIDPQDELICLRAHDAQAGGPALPPIAQASLFRQPSMERLLVGLSREDDHFIYSRGSNPTVAILEKTLAELERGEACKCFASGMGAISAVLFGLLEAGDHVLFVNDIYGPTIELAERLSRFGVDYSRTFATAAHEIVAAIRDQTRIIYIESPGSTLFGLAPIEAICNAAKLRGIVTVMDNTVATPLLQKPLSFGVDLVVHSCSKYIGGHSDVVGGAVVGSAALLHTIFYESYMLLGAAMAPFDAWLLLRGLMTLPARMQRHHADGLEIASFLQAHPRIERLFHPAFCESQSDLMNRQMLGHSGLFSVCVDVPDFSGLLTVANRLQLFGKAVSWGGAESLVMTGHKSDPGKNPSARVPMNLLRLSVGLEGADNLIRDLERALA